MVIISSRDILRPWLIFPSIQTGLQCDYPIKPHTTGINLHTHSNSISVTTVSSWECIHFGACLQWLKLTYHCVKMLVKVLRTGAKNWLRNGQSLTDTEKMSKSSSLGTFVINACGKSLKREPPEFTVTQILTWARLIVLSLPPSCFLHNVT